MENFSPKELSNQRKKTEDKKAKKIKKTKKNQKYITKIVNGEKHMILNPDYTFKHTD